MPRFGFSKDDEDGKKASLFSRKKSSSNTQDDNPYAQQTQQADPYAAPMTALQRQQASMGLPVGPRGGRPAGGLPSGPGPRAGGGPTPPGGGPNNSPYGAPPPNNQAPSSYGGPPANGPASYGGPPPNNVPSQQQSNGYSAGGYGASGGYGSNKYDSAPSYGSGPPLGRPPTYRSTADSDGPGSGGAGGYGGGAGAGAGAARLSARRGGYGGMGGRDDEADDSNRQALFGDAPQKYAERREQEGSDKYGSGATGGYGGGYGAGGGADATDSYGEKRDLTAEEQEDEDVKRMNQETRYLRNETDQSLDRSLMIANQSIETARSTMARMYNQRERLLNVESNLDVAANHNKIAEHRAAELKHYNRSMFAVKVNNPFTSKQRAAAHAQAALEEHRAEREQREETRRMAYLSNRNAEDSFDRLEKTADKNRRLGQSKTGVSSKFNLEDDDEEDIEKERQIDQKIDLLSGAVGTLNMTARAMNEFATEDLDHIDRIAGKSDNVDDQVRANRYRLERIEKGR
ncbi:Protein transport protein S9 plasma membrane t-SNARE [Sporothrix bragantina]|uniref:Protein transport protein S9 plasma membrane t-SNARE n=1 Tax=Sporothrix bragantina TaxID=671064 RepID=A0ABP0CAV3_9PEZI